MSRESRRFNAVEGAFFCFFYLSQPEKMKLEHLIGKTEYEEAEDWREAARALIDHPKVALYASPSFESVQFRDAKAGGTIAAQDRMKVKMFERDKKVAFEIIRRDEKSENLVVAAPSRRAFGLGLAAVCSAHG